jgi:hypothetical protein
MEYLAGGLLGNAPLLFTIFFLTFLDPLLLKSISSALDIVIMAVLVGGAALSAFYVAVGVQSSRIHRVIAVGVVTGGFCYLINLALSLFFQYFFFFPLPLGDYLKIATFLPGGALGAFIRTRSMRTVRRPPPSGSKAT